MMDTFLKSRLHRVIRRHQHVVLLRRLAICWSLCAVLAIALLFAAEAWGSGSGWVLPLVALGAVAASIVVLVRHARTEPDYRWIAQRIEARHPELGGVLATAVQQHYASPGEMSYFQYRLLEEAVARCQDSDWRDAIPRSRLLWAQAAHLVAFAVLALVFWRGWSPAASGGRSLFATSGGIVVTPGDVSIEKGETLVVLARFGDELPAAVDLVIRGSTEGAETIPLVQSMADPVFGGSVVAVETDFIYHLEYNGERTPDYKVTVFEHPSLVRSDADLAYPEYTGLPERRIEDTRRISAVEGSQLELSLQLNKPVASAALIARDEDKTSLPLTVFADRAVAMLPAFLLTATQTYDLQLLDADGRPNKSATPFVIEVQPNRPPELRIASPRGDVRPSALEELGFAGTVWDDFGSPAFGLGYTLAGGETEYLELGQDVPARENRSFEHLMKLEALAVEPHQLISWFAWADDIGPDGELRRTTSDLFFAEVRPFDEIFRETPAMGGGQQGQQQGGQGGQRQQLVELQKQIISATWKLQRASPGSQYADDTGVVRESQAQALEQARGAQQEAEDPRTQGLWTAATSEMERAISHLELARESVRPLGPALAAEQSAYQALLQLASDETAVTRRQGGGGGGGQQASQRQLDQLDLTQAENRYETQRQATAPQSPERREDMQVLNRLQELARRQEDFNERLQELQTAMQEARTEEEREEIRRQLQRLQEEQQQMLADVDELQQRMNRAENQSRMSEQREQLEQTREELQRSAEAVREGAVPQALASGTRAQRELEEMRDEMRRESSSQFAEDLRQMRAEARDLARSQEELSERLNTLGEDNRRSLSGNSEEQATLEQLAQQRERMTELVRQAAEISQQAETTEPLLSRELYDSLRRVNQEDGRAVQELQQDLLRSGRMTRDLYDRVQDLAEGEDGGRSLGLTAELVREGLMPQAEEAERRARATIEEMRRGVERAAESVLGDDAEALRLAQQELNDVTQQLREEMQALSGNAAGESGSDQAGEQPGQADQLGQAGAQSQQAGAEAAGEQQGQSAESLAQSGQPGERSSSEAQSGQGQPGQSGQQGEQGEQGQGQQGQQGEGQQGQQGQSALAQSGQGQQGQSGQGQQGQAGQGQRGQQGQRGGSQQAQQGSGGRGGAQQDGRSGGALAGGGDGFNERGWGGDVRERGPLNFDDILGGGEAGPVTGPLTGDDFAEWSDRLRNVEELIDDPQLRNTVAEARERARALRREYREDLTKPDWAVVQLEIERPLVEVRNRLIEELARRESRDPLVPIDRDPVPARFADQVQRYYEELGRDQ